MEQRDADYAVLVVPTPEEVPARLHSLREYQGDKMIAVFDPEDGSTLELEFAYRVARARVTAARDGADEIDAAALRATVGRADAAMDDVRKIKTQLTNAQNGIGGAQRRCSRRVEARVRGRAATQRSTRPLAPAAPQDALPIWRLGQQQLVVARGRGRARCPARPAGSPSPPPARSRRAPRTCPLGSVFWIVAVS